MKPKIESILKVANGLPMEENESFLLVIKPDQHGNPTLEKGFKIPAQIKPAKTIIIKTPGLTASEKVMGEWIKNQIQLLKSNN